MLIYHKPAPPKPPKRRSRAGCISCKQKKKKCNEKRPQCDRCEEKGSKCEYEAIKPRRRRRQSALLSPQGHSPKFEDGDWATQMERFHPRTHSFDNQSLDDWDAPSPYVYAKSEPFDEDLDNDVEDIVTSSTITNGSGTLARSRSQYPDLAMIAPSPVASPLLEFSSPVFLEFTEQKNRRGLIDHFCNVLSHLIVFKEDKGNPFQRLVLPLSHNSSPVLDAIFALSSAHLENRGIDTEEKSLYFHNRALQGLAKLIDRGESANREEVLGAIMLLVYYEVLVQRGNSNMVNGHLKGAMTVLRSQPQSGPAGMFLERAFRFYDVIAALSYDKAPISSSPSPMAPLSIPSTPSPSPLNSVDSLLGMATDLWPIIHRLSHLRESRRELQLAEAAGNTSKACVLRTELEATSNAIELALTSWTPAMAWPSKTTSPPPASPTTPKAVPVTFDLPASPPLPSPFLESPDHSPQSPFACHDADDEPATSPEATCRLQSIVNNADAYRHAALIFLFRDIKDLPRRHASVQRHTHLALLACSRVVEWAGPMSALLWPMFVGAVEAVSKEDRETAREAFNGTEQRQGMRNIARAWEIVEEVWKRDDRGEEVDWRKVGEEINVNIVFG